MKTFFSTTWKTLALIIAAALFTTGAYARAASGMKGDMTGETKMKTGAEIMISADHLIFASLERLNLTKDPTLEKGGALLAQGEKMILEGKQLMQERDTRIKGKEMMMNGSARMMEGKDLVVKELNSENWMKVPAVKAETHELAKSENLMLEGKNLMMDGERSFE